MRANAQHDGRPAGYIGGAICSTPQSLADAQYQNVEESIRMTEDRDKWKKYVHGVANPRIEDG